VACIREDRKVYKVWWESLKERDHLKEQGIDGRVELEWILRRVAWGVWSRFIWLRIGTSGRLK
jgi:hypothetical protein